MGKIMVTGALGNVGRNVISFLIDKGEQIVAADINVEASKVMYADTVEHVHFDFTDKDTFKNALHGVESVFIMRPPHLGKASDLEPFINELKHKSDLKIVVFLSLIGIENNPVPPHYKIEKMIENNHLPYCHVRPSFFMQNISGIHAFEIKHFDKIVVPVRKAKTSFIDAKDIGELISCILSKPESHVGKAYSITGPEAIDYFHVAKILSNVLGRNITYSNPSPRFAKKYWINVRNIDKAYATVMGLLYMMTRLGTAKKVTSTFSDLMGKEPRSFLDFANDNKDKWV